MDAYVEIAYHGQKASLKVTGLELETLHAALSGKVELDPCKGCTYEDTEDCPCDWPDDAPETWERLAERLRKVMEEIGLGIG